MALLLPPNIEMELNIIETNYIACTSRSLMDARFTVLYGILGKHEFSFKNVKFELNDSFEMFLLELL